MYELMFSNGLEINDKNDDIYSIEIISKLDSSTLSFGTVSSVSLNLKLNNIDKRFDTYTFKNKYVTIYINEVKKYKIYISNVRKKNGFLTLQGNDKIANLDVKFKGCSFPCSVYTLINACLKQCKLELGTIFFPNQGLVLHNVDLSGMTCREVLSYCMEVCGGIGLLDRSEKFIIKWFDTNKTQEIDTNKFISYSTDEEDVTFNNIRYMRNGVIYNSNSESDTITNSLYLTSDNPLLKGCSSSKLQTIIANLSNRCISYFPCKIQLSSSEKYDLGDCVTFTDEDGNEKIALVSNITIKNLSSVSIDSLSIDLSESEDEEDEEETTTTSGTTTSGNIMFYKTTSTTDIEFLECSNQTQIQYTLNFNIETLEDTLQVLVNTMPYKTYSVVQGNNTIALMLNSNLENTTTIEIATSNTLSDIETMCIYRNAQIIDYEEDDEPISIGESEYEIPSGYFFRTMKTFKINAGIQGWVYRHNESFKVTDSKKENYGKILDIQTMSIPSSSSVAAKQDDTQNLIEIYNQKNRDLYLDMINGTFYIRVLFSGTYRDYYGNSYTKENAPCDGWMVYKKKMKNDTEEKIYMTTTGIIEVDDGTTITLGCICANSREHKWEDFNSFTIHIENLNDDFQIANIAGSSGYGTYSTNLEDVTSVKTLNYLSNIHLTYLDECCEYFSNYYIGDYSKSLYNSVNYPEYQIIDKVDGIDLTYGGLTLFIFREFAKQGYEKYEIVS